MIREISVLMSPDELQTLREVAVAAVKRGDEDETWSDYGKFVNTVEPEDVIWLIDQRERLIETLRAYGGPDNACRSDACDALGDEWCSTNCVAKALTEGREVFDGPPRRVALRLRAQPYASRCRRWPVMGRGQPPGPPRTRTDRRNRPLHKRLGLTARVLRRRLVGC